MPGAEAVFAEDVAVAAAAKGDEAALEGLEKGMEHKSRTTTIMAGSVVMKKMRTASRSPTTP